MCTLAAWNVGHWYGYGDDEEDEVSVVFPAYAIVEPYAVVIEFVHALVTLAAVFHDVLCGRWCPGRSDRWPQ